MHRNRVLIAAALTLIGFGYWQWPFLKSRMAGFRIEEGGAFLANIARLFSGTGTYQYLAGSGLPAWCDVVAGVLLLGAALVPFTPLITRSATDSGWERLPVLCSLMSLFLFFMALGRDGLLPENTRYGLWMVAPCILISARALAAIGEARPTLRPALYGCMSLFCWLLLFGFWTHYFSFILHTGGRGNAGFQTAMTDPKAAAIKLILDKQPKERKFVVASSDWWVYWPMRYHAMDAPHLTMLLGDEMNQPGNATTLQNAMKSGDLWFAEFSSFSNTANLRGGLQRGDVAYEEYSTRAYDGRLVISIFRLHQK